MGQFNALFKTLLSAHEEYTLFEDEASVKEGEWFDDIENHLFSIKSKITYWLKNAKEENKSNKSNKSKSLYRSSRISASKMSKGSKTSKESMFSRGSKSSKGKKCEDKIRIA